MSSECAEATPESTEASDAKVLCEVRGVRGLCGVMGV